MEQINYEIIEIEQKHSPKNKLTEAQRLNWLQLIRTENVGPITFRNLINSYGGSAAALNALPELIRQGGWKRKPRLFPRDQAQREIDLARKIGVHLVARGEHGYPPWLKHIDDAPPLLYVAGNLELSHRPIISIVGSRNSSAVGRKITEELATDIAQAGFIVGSGLARGIDTVAHQASLAYGTIAVIASGINVSYPPENHDLQKKILSEGALITERPPNLKPRGKDFPRRNRIISGMSVAVVVVEAAMKSGSLITARLAADQGRDVFAVPGSPLDPRASGSNALLKDGAGVITHADDILQALSPYVVTEHPIKSADNEELEKEIQTSAPIPTPKIEQAERNVILEHLSPSPIEVDEIIRLTGLSASIVQVVLLELELAGRLLRHGQQLVSLAP